MYKVNYFLINLCISAMEREEVLINQGEINQREIEGERRNLGHHCNGIRCICTAYIVMIIGALFFWRVCVEFPNSYICHNGGTQN